jgi:hypothetical protein
VVDQVATEYEGEVNFVAVGGRSSAEATAERAEQWMPNDALAWGYDESLWALYEVRGQPVTYLIGADGTFVAGCDSVRECAIFGYNGEFAVREHLALLTGG